MKNIPFLRLVVALGGVALGGASFAHAQTAPSATVTAQSSAAMSSDDLAAALARFERGDRVDISAFYAARADAPFWTEGDGQRLGALGSATGDASAHGLPAGRYELEAGPDASVAEREAAAMDLYVRWARDLGAGVLQPSAVDAEIDLAPTPQPTDALLAALQTPDLSATLKGFEPADADYRRLMTEMVRLREVVADGGWGEPAPDGETLHVGDRAPRVAGLRTRLAALGYGGKVAKAEPEVFDIDLEAAVMAFQRDAGLVDDGVPGHRTLAALNKSPEDRMRQVTVNLERLRWRNGDMTGNRYIVANIPDYTVRLSQGDAVIWESRSVVGKSDDTRTPEFSDVMTYMVVNPTWHVPKSISTRIYLPKLQKDPGLFNRQGMRLFTRSGAEVNPRLVDFRSFTVENFPFQIKQKPSDDNALGLVKFMFPNKHAIYLHDTPAKGLFGKDARAFSNGCIRLEQPYDLARTLLGPQVDDPAARFQALLDGKSERRVELVEPVTVHLVYRTAFGDDAGVIRYRDDVYGRDAAVFRALQEAGLTLNAAQG